MKPYLRSIQLLLILVLISFLGITPASSAKETALPEPYDCYRSYEEITNRMAELANLYPGLARVKTIGLVSRVTPSRRSNLAEKSKQIRDRALCSSAD